MSLREDIESRIQILDIVNRYVSTKKAWVNYKWLCPFHQEKSPSFVISPSKNIAHCFSCGKWWGPINFLMEIEKIEFREAVAILAKEAWIEFKTDFVKEKQEKWEDIYALYREATLWYHNALFLPENKNALDYVLGRWLSLETIKKFELGFSYSPRDLLFFLKEKEFQTKFLIDSGLFVSESRDKFFGRVIFPIKNAMGHTIAFTGRAMWDAQPKYLNSPASHIFDKSSVLYGFHLAKQSISKKWEVYIVEWQMDTIALHQAWVDNAVGISGTALTKDHIRILRRFAKTVFLALDSDDAGVKATFSSIENLLNEDLEIRIIQIPNGKDPDEYTKSGGDFSLLRGVALSAIEFYLIEWKRQFDIEWIVWKKKLIEKCLEIITRLQSQIEIDLYLKQISKVLDISMEILYSEYKKVYFSFRKQKILKNFPEKQPLVSWRNSEVSEKSTRVFSLSDFIAGYIHRYGFLDLFFREFWYTDDDLRGIEWSRLLMDSISNHLDDDDREILRVLDLHLEENHTHANTELIERSFRDLLRNLNKLLLEQEKKNKLEKISPESPEYLQVYADILKKEKQFWLR